jgi:hypothetical protein
VTLSKQFTDEEKVTGFGLNIQAKIL